MNVSRALFSILMLFILSISSLGTVKFLNVRDVPNKNMEKIVKEDLKRRGFSPEDIDEGYVGFIVERDGFYTEEQGFDNQVTFVFNDEKFLVMEENVSEKNYDAHVVVEIMEEDLSNNRQSAKE